MNQESYLKAGSVRIALRTIRNIVLATALILVGVGVGYNAKFNSRNPLSAFGLGPSTGQTRVSLERDNLDFSLFWAVWDELERSYLNPDQLDAQKMVFGAIEGMTASLGDPYTVFLPPQEQQAVKEDLSGEFDGVGISLGYKQDTIAVMTPLEGHPAIQKGVKAGDLILHIKDERKNIDQDTMGMTLPEAVKLIRGKKGTSVTLTLYREGKGSFDVTIERDTIVIPAVTFEQGDWTEEGWKESETGKVAWIKMTRFGDNGQDEWDEAVSQYLANKNQLEGIVLDLRNNPGGYMELAVTLASDFIPEGVVVKQEGRYDTETYTVNRRGRLLSEPLVVLINGGSASASEILAGALRDRLKTPLVGEKSFGKGTVQHALDLPKDAGLHVTIARWILPNGDWIHEKGLEPTVPVELPDVTEASESAKIVDTQLQKAIETLRSL